MVIELERKQLVIGVLLLALVGYLGYAAFRGPALPIADRVLFVDVTTGETRELRKEEFHSIPAVNPSTGERTMFPAFWANDKLFIGEHYRADVEALGNRAKAVVPQTLKVLQKK